MKRPFRASPSETVAAEFKTREKYELPFIWGSLHVTEQADAAYGLVPLTTQSLESEANRLSGIEAKNFRTDIWLVGPKELEYLPPSYPDSPIFSGRSETQTSDKGIEVICGFAKDDEEITQFVLELTESDGMELPEDAPPDLLTQGAHQMIAHGIVDIVATNVAFATQHLLENDTGNTVLSRARKDFLIGLGGGTYMSVSQLVMQGHVDTFGEVASGGLVVGGAMFAYHGLRQYIHNMAAIRRMIDEKSNQFGMIVASDIHRTYCTKHFDSQAKEMFGPMPEDLQ